jgi:hypothetical protein
MSTFFNSPEADKSTKILADKGLMRLRRINFPHLGAIMDIPIDTPLLYGWVVHSQINNSGKMTIALLASLESVKMGPKIVD